MPTSTTSELRKPISWDEFENIVWNIYKREWNNPHAQRYGRAGQEQQGVDVYGRLNGQGDLYIGIQCKLYENLKIKTVKEEIGKAERFKPPLASLIIVTTDYQDAQLQKDVRLINKRRKKPLRRKRCFRFLPHSGKI